MWSFGLAVFASLLAALFEMGLVFCFTRSSRLCSLHVGENDDP